LSFVDLPEKYEYVVSIVIGVPFEYDLILIFGLLVSEHISNSIDLIIQILYLIVHLDQNFDH
jgi:hypothetical protein